MRFCEHTRAPGAAPPTAEHRASKTTNTAVAAPMPSVSVVTGVRESRFRMMRQLDQGHAT